MIIILCSIFIYCVEITIKKTYIKDKTTNKKAKAKRNEQMKKTIPKKKKI